MSFPQQKKCQGGCIIAPEKTENNPHVERTLLWIYVSTHPTGLRPSPRLRCSALNRQWLIYGVIVYSASLLVMDDDLRTFESSVWNTVVRRTEADLL